MQISISTGTDIAVNLTKKRFKLSVLQNGRLGEESLGFRICSEKTKIM